MILWVSHLSVLGTLMFCPNFKVGLIFLCPCVTESVQLAFVSVLKATQIIKNVQDFLITHGFGGVVGDSDASAKTSM